MRKKEAFYLHILLVSIILIIAAIFLPWVSFNAFFFSIQISGWSLSFLLKIFLILIAGALIVILLKTRAGVISFFILAVVGLVVLLLRILFPPTLHFGLISLPRDPGTLIKYLGIGFYMFIIGLVGLLISTIKLLRKL